MRKVAFYSKWLDGSNGLVKDCPKNEMEQNETETLLLAMPSNSAAGFLARVVKGVVSFLQTLLSPQTRKEGVRRGQVSRLRALSQTTAVGTLYGLLFAGLLLAPLPFIQANWPTTPQTSSECGEVASNLWDAEQLRYDKAMDVVDRTEESANEAVYSKYDPLYAAAAEVYDKAVTAARAVALAATAKASATYYACMSAAVPLTGPALSAALAACTISYTTKLAAIVAAFEAAEAAASYVYDQEYSKIKAREDAELENIRLHYESIRNSEKSLHLENHDKISRDYLKCLNRIP